MIQSTDVFVIGAGPAGLAAGIAARKKGFDVTIADGAEPPIDKACGEGLLPNAVQVLQRLGLELNAADGFPLRGIRFIDGDLAVSADFACGSGRGFRRVALHQAMVEHARQAGIRLLWKTPVSGISGSRVSLPARAIAAQWIVGADGIHSRVRRWTSMECRNALGVRYAFRLHYRVHPWSDYAEIYWGHKAQAYVTPVNQQDICVVLISRDPKLRFDSISAEFPQLTKHLSSAVPTDVERGAVTLLQHARRVCDRNVALIGDASGSVDAISGEGLSLGFHQALVLADALEAGDLSGYQAAHRRLARRARLMARMLLALDGHETLRHRVIRTLAAHPDLFARLLAVHIGVTSPRHLIATGASLGWRFVTA